MSDTNSTKRVKPKRNIKYNLSGSIINYNNLEELANHSVDAVRRGLYARFLGQLRQRAGLNQAELAEALGVRQPTVGKWEHGYTALSWLDARRIGKVLKCDPHLLYDDPELRKGASLVAPPDAAQPHNGPDAPPLPEEGARWWRMSGQALALRGVQHGDLVAIAGKRHAHDGCIALLALGEPEGNTRYLLRERKGAYFCGAGPDLLPEPIPYDPSAAHVIGIAIALYRSLVQPPEQGLEPREIEVNNEES